MRRTFEIENKAKITGWLNSNKMKSSGSVSTSKSSCATFPKDVINALLKIQ